MYDTLSIVCYVLGAACFFVAFMRNKFVPTSLDIVALGLFFMSIPFILERL